MIDTTKVEIGTHIIFKKAHPCGGFEWEVTRIGIDWRLKCTTCNRIILIPRIDAVKRIKEIKESN